jgi:hypothetical protein
MSKRLFPASGECLVNLVQAMEGQTVRVGCPAIFFGIVFPDKARLVFPPKSVHQIVKKARQGGETCKKKRFGGRARVAPQTAKNNTQVGSTIIVVFYAPFLRTTQVQGRWQIQVSQTPAAVVQDGPRKTGGDPKTGTQESEKGENYCRKYCLWCSDNVFSHFNAVH